MEDNPLAKLVSYEAPIVTNDEGELFDVKNHTDVMWEEEPHHGPLAVAAACSSDG